MEHRIIAFSAQLLTGMLSVIGGTILRAENVHTINTGDGLSSSAVLSLHQDDEGYVYVGTIDGLNIWDGRRFIFSDSGGRSDRKLSGNIIESIYPLRNGMIWIRTNYGLDLMEGRQVIESHKEFTGVYNLICSDLSHSLVLTRENKLYGYNSGLHRFTELHDTQTPDYFSYIGYWNTYECDRILIFEDNGIYEAEMALDKYGNCRLGSMKKILDKKLQYVSGNANKGFIVGDDSVLYSFSEENNKLFYLTDIGSLIAQFGRISEIMSYGDDILISFMYNGLVRLRYSANAPGLYTAVHEDVDCGIFALMQDRHQNIVWAGTDGNGIAMYIRNDVDVHNFMNDAIGLRSTTPVRALYLDGNNGLYVATKGEGIMMFPDFDPSKKPGRMQVRHIGRNEGLSDQIVYALQGSADGNIWIGTEGHGIDYIEASTGRVKQLKGSIPKDLKWVHAIYESSRGTLWAATVGRGVFRLKIEYSGSVPSVSECERLDIRFPKSNNNFFFCLYPDADGTFWFGNRGGGIVHYFPDTAQYEVISFENELNNLANDVWSVTRDKNGTMYLGTSYGLIKLGDNGKAEDTGIHQTIRGLLTDSSGMLWLSTASGIYKYDTDKNTYTRYDRTSGVEMTEFCDGAFFRDKASDRLFFGATEGFAVLERTGHANTDYHPQLKFRSVRMDNKPAAFSSVCDKGRITIEPGHTLNSISFSALDHINGNNIVYSYMLDGYDEWTTAPGEIQFTPLAYGDYRLFVRYTDTSSGYTSDVQELKIRIKAPWFQTLWAKIAAAIAAAAGTVIVTLSLLSRRRKRKRQQIERVTAKMKQESLEARLNMISTFSQEMTSPVTMISTLIQQMEETVQPGSTLQRYGTKLRHQIEKLGKVLSVFQYYSESSELKESTSHRIFSVNELVSVISESFYRPCSKKNAELIVSADNNMLCAGDYKRTAAIIDSLLTNALIHSPQNGRIHLEAHINNGSLEITVSSIDRWISRENAERIFDKFYAIDYFSKRNEDSSLVQDEMRLAICNNIALSLGGKIEYVQNVDNLSFRVILPGAGERATKDEYDATKDGMKTGYSPMVTHSMIVGETIRKHNFEENKKVMYLIGKDTALLNLIADIFSEEFNVVTFNYIDDCRTNMKSQLPDIMICENIRMNRDINNAIADIKKDRSTVRIPIILLTSGQQLDDDMDNGSADISIPVPFNLSFLKSAVRQSLSRVEDLRKYYSSAVSAYEFCDGQILHRDDKQFVDKVFDTIRANVSDSGFGTEQLAKAMNMSLSKLYNKLRESIGITPSALLREYRLKHAEKLLLSSRLSIDEIIYKCGFVNRGTFFKSFQAHAGCTPKQFRERHDITAGMER